MMTLQQNPFVVNGKIDRKYFCDRKKESAQLIRNIVNSNNTVLISPRRMGKRGLIRYCFESDDIRDNYLTIFIDILQTSSMREFTFLLGKEVFTRLRPNKILLDKFVQTLKSITGKFGYDPITGSPSFDISLGDITKPEYTLEEIFRWIEDSSLPVILAIDEFQQVAKYAEKNAEAILRTVMQHTSNVTFIFAGSQRHLLSRMFADSTRPFYNSASFMHLDPIPLHEYKIFVEEMFALGDKRVKPETIENVYGLVEANTFYMQKIFNLAYSATSIDKECELNEVTEAVEEMFVSYDTIFRESMSRVTESQKALLIAIAREKDATGVTSSSFIRRHALESASAVQNALRKLIDLDYLTREGNTYSVSDKFLRLWILRIYTEQKN